MQRPKKQTHRINYCFGLPSILLLFNKIDKNLFMESWNATKYFMAEPKCSAKIEFNSSAAEAWIMAKQEAS